MLLQWELSGGVPFRVPRPSTTARRSGTSYQVEDLLEPRPRRVAPRSQANSWA